MSGGGVGDGGDPAPGGGGGGAEGGEDLLVGERARGDGEEPGALRGIGFRVADDEDGRRCADEAAEAPPPSGHAPHRPRLPPH